MHCHHRWTFENGDYIFPLLRNALHNGTNCLLLYIRLKMVMFVCSHIKQWSIVIRDNLDRLTTGHRNVLRSIDSGNGEKPNERKACVCVHLKLAITNAVALTHTQVEWACNREPRSDCGHSHLVDSFCFCFVCSACLRTRSNNHHHQKTHKQHINPEVE